MRGGQTRLSATGARPAGLPGSCKRRQGASSCTASWSGSAVKSVGREASCGFVSFGGGKVSHCRAANGGSDPSRGGRIRRTAGRIHHGVDGSDEYLMHHPLAWDKDSWAELPSERHPPPSVRRPRLGDEADRPPTARPACGRATRAATRGWSRRAATRFHATRRRSTRSRAYHTTRRHSSPPSGLPFLLRCKNVPCEKRRGSASWTVLQASTWLLFFSVSICEMKQRMLIAAIFPF